MARVDMKLQIPLDGLVLNVKAFAAAKPTPKPAAKLYHNGEPVERVTVSASTGNVTAKDKTERMFDTGGEVIPYPQEAVDKILDAPLKVHGLVSSAEAATRLSVAYYLVPENKASDKVAYFSLYSALLAEGTDAALDIEYTNRSVRHRALIEVSHGGDGLMLTNIAYTGEYVALSTHFDAIGEYEKISGDLVHLHLPKKNGAVETPNPMAVLVKSLS